MKHPYYLAAAFGSVILISGYADAQNKNAPAPPVVLTEAGKALESKYTTLQATLKTEIEKALPKLDNAKIAAWQQAIQAEEAPAKEAAVKASKLAKLQGAEANLRELEDKLKLAPNTIEDAKAELERARARGEEDPEKAKFLASSESFLVSRQKDMDKITAAIKQAKTAVAEAKSALPAAIEAAKVAKEAHLKATSATWQAMDALGTSTILSSNALDGKLARYMVIAMATPRGLAEFAEKSAENAKLIEQLLADEALMIQMLVADGPTEGKFGDAMKIYTDIQKASPKAKEGTLQRVALAVSLSHAVPVVTRVPNNRPDSNEPAEVTAGQGTVDSSKLNDPVKRYMNYEKWYLSGELQPGFKDLSVWNLAYAVNSADPDYALAWVREMVRTMRPDCIPPDNDTSPYVEFVDKEIRYGSDQVKEDLPENAFMQNVLANGGICGRRGFFGTFMMQAFGVPAVERAEPGHSTLAHWHLVGWQTRLGGNWGRGPKGYGRMGGRAKSYGADVNFLASSQARENAADFMKVRRSQWIAAVAGESFKPGLITLAAAPPKPGQIVKPTFWSDLALHEQRRIIANQAAWTSKATKTTKAPGPVDKATIAADGVITIPAASCSRPTENQIFLYHGGYMDQISFVKDNKSGEVRLNLSRYCKEVNQFEYTFDAPQAGKYQLAANAATPKWGQRLIMTANGGKPLEMPLPYTIGLLGKSEPVEVELKAGSNVLKFHGPVRVSIDKFTLTPVAGK